MFSMLRKGGSRLRGFHANVGCPGLCALLIATARNVDIFRNTETITFPSRTKPKYVIQTIT